MTKELGADDTIAVLDFGSQYSHLIVRRIRELGVYAELLAPETPAEKLKGFKAIVLSGGPQNLSESTALKADPKVYKLGVPILGVCYGMQLMAHQLGGKVKAGKKREYGPTLVQLSSDSALFKGLGTSTPAFSTEHHHPASEDGGTPPQLRRGEEGRKRGEMTWMSHGDQVAKMPKGFIKIAASSNCSIAGMATEDRQLYALQFHPEVIHTKNGRRILDNFLRLCGVSRGWSMKHFVSDSIRGIKEQVGDNKAVCALSGGVDSSIAATLVNRAIGGRLTCIFVDTGLMRAGEVPHIRKNLGRTLGLSIKIVDAKKQFLTALTGITEPEKKRKTIGNLFIRIFEREARKIGGVKFLVQGTLYTDVVSSGFSSGGAHTAVIKSHHNVGGLPERFGFTLIEPLRDLYKYEVRKVGDEMKLPEAITYRMPFPGPGLAVRIIGEVTEEKLNILRHADRIVTEEMGKTRLVKDPYFFYFCALPDIRSVGVQGDARTYGRPIILRAVQTAEFLTADWVHLPYPLLERISVRITNEVAGINRVVYDITSKPPGTVEWE